MNYLVLSSIAKLKHEMAKWEEADLSVLTMPEVFERYSEVRCNMQNVFTKEKGGLLLYDLISELSDWEGTFVEWLEMKGNFSLKLNKQKYTLKTKGLLYDDIFLGGFKVYPTVSGGMPDGSYEYKHLYKDLFITKKDVDPIDLQKHTLITVNGFIHQTDANDKGLWVQDGWNSIFKSGKRCMGCISFENLGSLKQIPIKKEMISKIFEKTPLHEECIIDIGEDTSEKTIILIIGGYMHVLDYDVFFRVSDSAIKLKMSTVPLLERVHYSDKYLDMDDMGFDRRQGDTNIHLKELLSDECIIRLLTKSQSFIVLLDNPEVFKEITFPRQRAVPNQYISETRPRLPLIGGLGKIEEYIVYNKWGRYLIETADSQVDQRVYNTTRPIDENSLYNAGRKPGDRRRRAHANFFDLKTMLAI